MIIENVCQFTLSQCQILRLNTPDNPNKYNLVIELLINREMPYLENTQTQL